MRARHHDFREMIQSHLIRTDQRELRRSPRHAFVTEVNVQPVTAAGDPVGDVLHVVTTDLSEHGLAFVHGGEVAASHVRVRLPYGEGDPKGDPAVLRVVRQHPLRHVFHVGCEFVEGVSVGD